MNRPTHSLNNHQVSLTFPHHHCQLFVQSAARRENNINVILLRMTLTKQSRRCCCLNSNLRSKQGELEPLWTSVKRSSLRPVLNDKDFCWVLRCQLKCRKIHIQITEKTIENSEVACATRVLLTVLGLCSFAQQNVVLLY